MFVDGGRYTRNAVFRSRVERLAAWLDQHRIAVLAMSLVLALGGALLAIRMPLKSDLTNLLPPTNPSVRDLTAIQKRARPFGTVQVVIEGPDAATRERASAALIPRLRTVGLGAGTVSRPLHSGRALVQQFAADDGALRRYVWQQRFLFADLADLVAARDALIARIERGKLKANPLYIELDDAPADPDDDRLADLERKLAEAEQAAIAPAPWVSKDGRLQQVAIQTTFSASNARLAGQLTDQIRREIAAVEAEVPGARFGLTGNITLTMYEHDSVLDGMAISAIVTVLLCAVALLLYYRSGRTVLAMLWALGCGVAATFAAAWATVGHLNVMTAFLFAIVIGNGINAGLILVARYMEELRAGKDARAAVAGAIIGALRGTLAAAATASVAYASLLITDFRGFRQFGAIAGLGMALTWLATFTVLPAALFVIARRGHGPGREPAIGAILVRILPTRQLRSVLMAATVVTAIAMAITIGFLTNDPFLHDWRDLQSSTEDIRRVRAISARVNAALDTQSQLAGQAYQIVIAVERRDQVGPLIEGIRASDAARPVAKRWTRDVRSLDDLVPSRQPEKLAVLAEIRALLDDPKLQATIDDDDRAMLAKLRPPDDLAPTGDHDVPRELAWPFIEKDGSIGRLIVIRGAKRWDSFNVDHRLAFAAEVRRIELPARALIAGEPLVVADIVATMERDAPKMIVFSLIGSILAVFVVIGMRRHGLVTIACGLAGVVIMMATCFLVGLRVHFLDLIALPITIGIGIDYAVNLAARDAQDGDRGLPYLLRTTGGAVLLCSFTTAVGYGTLMFSANGGIRSFGIAALIGEVACVLTALIVAPAWLALLRRRRETHRTSPSPLSDNATIGP